MPETNIARSLAHKIAWLLNQMLSSGLSRWGCARNKLVLTTWTHFEVEDKGLHPVSQWLTGVKTRNGGKGQGMAGVELKIA